MRSRDWFFRQKITQAEMDAFSADIEQADWDQYADGASIGVFYGLAGSQQVVPDLTVNISGPGVAYTPQGKRVFVPATQIVNCAVDSNNVSTSVAGGGNSKIISIFARFARNPTDPRIDGNSNNVFFLQGESFELQVVQSAEAVTPTPPALQVDGILLCDITRAFGQTTFVNANISVARRQDQFALSGSPIAVQQGRAVDAMQDILDAVNNIISGVITLPATNITYAGGGVWADGTTNPATTVELQLDKIITDLAATTSDVINGAARIGFVSLNSFPSGQSIVSVRVDDVIEELVTAYGSQTAPHSGARQIGYAGSGNWANGSPVGTQSVEGALDQIISDLAAVALGASGAHRVGYDGAAGGSGLWTDGTGLSAGTVAGAIDEIVSDLSSTSGGLKIGVTASGNWVDGTNLAAGSVKSQLAEIVSDLVSTTNGTSGGEKIGTRVQTAGSFTLSAGSIASQLASMVGFHNTHVTLASAAHAATAISYAGSGNWADATAITSTNVETAIDEIVSDLGATTGAVKIGYSGSGNWQSGGAVTASNVEGALDEIVSDLADTSASPNSGANRVGSAQSVNGYLVAGSVYSQINDLESIALSLGHAIYGDGSDGVLITGGAPPTLTRDMYYSSLTVTAGDILDSNGYRIFCRDILIMGGTIENSGNNGSGGAGTGTGGIGGNAGTLRGGTSGGNGTATTGNNGTNNTGPDLGGGGGGGGAGTNAAGTGGTVTAPTADHGSIKSLPGLASGRYSGRAAAADAVVGGGAGGGAGGGSGSVGGGGGGGGGGVVFVCAPLITGSGTLRANGGAGGTPTGAGNRGGGGGGGGGYVHVVRSVMSPSSFVLQANGGTAGTGINGGATGTNGTNGTTAEYEFM